MDDVAKVGSALIDVEVEEAASDSEAGKTELLESL